MNLSRTPRILVVRLSSIGDVVMATPVARVLRNHFPNAYIAWVVEPKSAEVIVGNPYLDETIVWSRMPSKSWLTGFCKTTKSLMDLIPVLQSREFDIAIDLQGLMKSASIAYLSSAKERIGLANGRELSPLLYTRRLVEDVELPRPLGYLSLLTPLGIESDDDELTILITRHDREVAETIYREQKLDPARTVAFCPATSRAIKRWPNDHWARLAEFLWREYGLSSVILGSTADISLAESICHLSEVPVSIAAGRTSLMQSAAILEKCSAVVAVDTALLHIAVGLDKPSIGLFGPYRWQQLIRKPNFIWLAKDLPCSPCRNKPTCANIDCMQAIRPSDVLQSLHPWINNNTSKKQVS